MAKRMLVVRNPKAGSFLSQNTFLEAAGVIFKDESFNVYVYTTTGRGDATRIAREEGCRFYLGSDAHTPAELAKAKANFEAIIDLLGLTEDDKIPLLTGGVS